MRNLILAKSQTSLLINQRCRLSFIAKCVSLSHTVCGCWSMLSSVSINTHTFYLSLSLCYLALFPPLSVSLKSPLCSYLIINWNTDFTVLGCSHFIGSINMKIGYSLQEEKNSSDMCRNMCCWWQTQGASFNLDHLCILCFVMRMFSKMFYNILRKESFLGVLQCSAKNNISMMFFEFRRG